MRGRRRLARNGGRTLSRAFGASSPASGRGERITLRANKQHRAFALPRLVIARSGSDQAIQLPAQAALDCFADARNDASLIPPRVAGRGGPPERAVGGASAGTPAPPPPAPSTTLRAVPLPRFAGADKEKHSRDALRARALLTTKKRKKTNKQKEGRRSAERRIVSPIAACAAARLSMRGAPAFRRSATALATGCHPDGSAPEPGFRKDAAARCFAGTPQSCLAFSTLRTDRSFCRPTGAPGPPGNGLRDRARASALAPQSRSHPECALR
jgi:hypothetical protein